MNPFSGKSALVTGASAGLGEEFAIQLARLGVSKLTLVARREDRLRDLQARLRPAHPKLQVDLFPADLGNEEVVAGLLKRWEEAAFAPDILISNAGFGDLGTFESSEPATIELMLAVNVVALTRLTRWLVPHLLQKGEGWICHVGSTAGMIPLPSFAVYGATKAYVNSFSEAVRAELHGTGINVLALCPGPVETEFGSVAGRANSQRQFKPPAIFLRTKESVVRDTLQALAHGQGRLIPGLLVRFAMLATESTPRCILRLVFNLTSGQFRRERQERSTK